MKVTYNLAIKQEFEEAIEECPSLVHQVIKNLAIRHSEDKHMIRVSIENEWARCEMEYEE